MKKIYLFILTFVITIGSVCAQSRDNYILQIDNVVKALSSDIHRKLTEEKAAKVAISNQFAFGGSIPPLGSYWSNNLTGELANISNRPYILLADGIIGADVRISGEIVEIADIIRIYTRLIRQDNRAILAVFSSDIERNAVTTSMLAGGRSGSVYVPLDDYEPDSWENPVPFEIGENENVTIIDRTIHEYGDEDFFLLVPKSSGRLVMETTGNTDTYMEFYDADTRQLLTENDDDGENANAKIIYSIEAERHYIAKVRGYGGETTGQYAFRAYIVPPRAGASVWENPIQYVIGTGQNAQVVNRTIFEGGDTDFFLLAPNSSGRLVVETTGDIDTYIEFYDADTKQLLDEDDDGGEETNARITYNVDSGKRYIAKVRGYSNDVTGSYGFRSYIR